MMCIAEAQHRDDVQRKRIVKHHTDIALNCWRRNGRAQIIVAQAKHGYAMSNTNDRKSDNIS